MLPEALKHANGASGPLSENGPVRTTSYQSLPRCELAVSDLSMWDEMWVLSPTYFLGRGTATFAYARMTGSCKVEALTFTSEVAPRLALTSDLCRSAEPCLAAKPGSRTSRAPGCTLGVQSRSPSTYGLLAARDSMTELPSDLHPWGKPPRTRTAPEAIQTALGSRDRTAVG